MLKPIFLGLTLIAVTPAIAQDAPPAPQAKLVNEDVGVPVFPYDITDRPYTVLGEVKAGVRKATVFSKSPSQKKIYRELWERAEKLGADAVINANYGDAHMTVMSWGKTNATGTAIKFLPAGTPMPAKTPAPSDTPTPSGN
ncbi:hypothetical protein PIB19_00935 [Sphingomonas sp. 7/4-4]|uniref:hypothetical protein n=1 Tax=Sphingomonas sp. 7/4-4 TaxID=3018446 RepID=UPI0022F3C2A2|nr:hypothetical protein [Sphingomonas sp. 7/4-4]WBY08153.1 hypothetical protein PIB19_00935 [Sphingomonas sp. 7/4-4]